MFKYPDRVILSSAVTRGSRRLGVLTRLGGRTFGEGYGFSNTSRRPYVRVRFWAPIWKFWISWTGLSCPMSIRGASFIRWLLALLVRRPGRCSPSMHISVWPL